MTDLAPRAADTAPVEHVLCDLIAAATGFERAAIDPHRPAARYGLDSLAALQLRAQIEAAFGAHVALQSLRDDPIGVVAERLERTRADAPQAVLPADPAARFEPFALTDVQEAYWVGRRPDYVLGGVAAHGYLELSVAELDAVKLQESWERLVARHDMLRAVVDDHGRQRVLEVVPAATIPVADMSGRPAEVVTRHLAGVRARLSAEVRPADRWPLWTIEMTQTDGGATVHLGVDLLVADLQSVRIVLSELSRLCRDPDVDLPPLQATFRDWVVAQRSMPVDAAAVDGRLAELGDAARGPRLPLVTLLQQVTPPRFERFAAALDEPAWSAFTATAEDHGVTPSAALLTAFAAVIGSWSDTDAFCTTVTVFDRPAPELANVVGDFTSLLAVPFRHAPGATFAEHAAVTASQLWGALEDRTSGVAVLRELARRTGDVDAARLPVVFTSAVHLDSDGGDGFGVPVYEVTQTPQVLLDHQLAQRDGGLSYSWDFVVDAFDRDDLVAVFDAYGRLLRQLCTDPDSWEQPLHVTPVRSEGSHADDAYPDGWMADEAQRRRFVLAEHGLRRDLDDAEAFLVSTTPADALREGHVARRSVREFAAGAVEVAALGRLLDTMRQLDIDGRSKRRYPSAGHLYAVQAYVIVAPGRVAGVPPGGYYFDPLDGSLRAVEPTGVLPPSAHAPVNRDLAATASFTVVLAVDLDAIEPMYSAQSQDFALLEAGYAAQALMTAAPAAGLGLCPVGMIDGDALRRALALGARRVPLHALVGGVPADAAAPDAATPATPRQAAARPGAAAVVAALAELAREVVGRPIDVDADLLTQGVNSLEVVRLVNAIEQRFGVRVPIPQLHVRALRDVAADLDSADARPMAAATFQSDAAARFDPFALTDVQAAYWVGRQTGLELGGVATHAYQELDCADLDVGRLERALDAVVRRHDALRTIITSDGRQRVLEQVPPVSIPVTDLADASPAAIESHLARVRGELSHQVLATDRWPLFDIRATVTGGRRTRLHLSLDLLMADLASFGVVFDELRQLYAGADRDLLLPGLSFRDYVLAEPAADDPRHLRDERWWTERLPTLPPAPAIPAIGDALLLTPPRFTRRETVVAAGPWRALVAGAQRHGVTPAVTVLTAYADVMAAASGSRHFTLNVTQFNRRPVHPDVDRVVGDFSSVLPVVFDATAGTTFLERATETQRVVFEGLDHAHFSGVAVLRALGRRQGGRPRPVLPIVFTSAPQLGRGAPAPTAWLGQPIYGISQTPQVHLDCQLSEDGDRLRVVWDSVDGLHAPDALDRMFDAFSNHIRAVAADEAWTLGLPSVYVAPARGDATSSPAPSVGPATAGGAEVEVVRSLAAEAMELPALGTDDDWLGLGASSLVVVRIVNAVEERLGVRPDLGAVFDQPTARAVAALCTTGAYEEGEL